MLFIVTVAYTSTIYSNIINSNSCNTKILYIVTVTDYTTMLYIVAVAF